MRWDAGSRTRRRCSSGVGIVSRSKAARVLDKKDHQDGDGWHPWYRAGRADFLLAHVCCSFLSHFVSLNSERVQALEASIGARLAPWGPLNSPHRSHVEQRGRPRWERRAGADRLPDLLPRGTTRENQLSSCTLPPRASHCPRLHALGSGYYLMAFCPALEAGILLPASLTRPEAPRGANSDCFRCKAANHPEQRRTDRTSVDTINLQTGNRSKPPVYLTARSAGSKPISAQASARARSYGCDIPLEPDR